MITLENLRSSYRLDEMAIVALQRIGDLIWVCRELIVIGCPVAARLTARTMASLALTAVPELREGI